MNVHGELLPKDPELFDGYSLMPIVQPSENKRTELQLMAHVIFEIDYERPLEEFRLEVFRDVISQYLYDLA